MKAASVHMVRAFSVVVLIFLFSHSLSAQVRVVSYVRGQGRVDSSFFRFVTGRIPEPITAKLISNTTGALKRRSASVKTLNLRARTNSIGHIVQYSFCRLDSLPGGPYELIEFKFDKLPYAKDVFKRLKENEFPAWDDPPFIYQVALRGNSLLVIHYPMYAFGVSTNCCGEVTEYDGPGKERQEATTAFVQKATADYEPGKMITSSDL